MLKCHHHPVQLRTKPEYYCQWCGERLPQGEYILHLLTQLKEQTALAKFLRSKLDSINYIMRGYDA